ncbi:unnamed protein product [Oikopleura dioica]|uniref:Uncharacterized protein n=1 Tax=Oikopleura dioica TaxID=34765 RepID=E4YV14_OIKDI|nr:unnamed protein product [Oikopleura dioica]
MHSYSRLLFSFTCSFLPSSRSKLSCSFEKKRKMILRKRWTAQFTLSRSSKHFKLHYKNLIIESEKKHGFASVLPKYKVCFNLTELVTLATSVSEGIPLSGLDQSEWAPSEYFLALSAQRRASRLV